MGYQPGRCELQTIHLQESFRTHLDYSAEVFRNAGDVRLMIGANYPPGARPGCGVIAIWTVSVER